MIKDLKDTQTEKNLYRAFTGEALAHLKYQFYKSKLSEYSKEYETILDEIIHNEKEHGKIWFKLLNDGIQDNETNLLDAIHGETFEHTDMYPTFSKIAEEEGFHEIAELFKSVGEIEGTHAETFKMLQIQLKDDLLFKSYSTEKWKCLNCGYEYTGKNAPTECPVCKHPRKYFQKIL